LINWALILRFFPVFARSRLETFWLLLLNLLYDIICVCLALIKIDFEWIDYVKLIVTKSELKVKWSMFVYIHVKMTWTINLSVKINSRIKNSNF